MPLLFQKPPATFSVSRTHTSVLWTPLPPCPLPGGSDAHPSANQGPVPSFPAPEPMSGPDHPRQGGTCQRRSEPRLCARGPSLRPSPARRAPVTMATPVRTPAAPVPRQLGGYGSGSCCGAQSWSGLPAKEPACPRAHSPQGVVVSRMSRLLRAADRAKARTRFPACSATVPFPPQEPGSKCMPGVVDDGVFEGLQFPRCLTGSRGLLHSGKCSSGRLLPKPSPRGRERAGNSSYKDGLGDLQV